MLKIELNQQVRALIPKLKKDDFGKLRTNSVARPKLKRLKFRTAIRSKSFWKYTVKAEDVFKPHSKAIEEQKAEMRQHGNAGPPVTADEIVDKFQKVHHKQKVHKKTINVMA